MKTTLATLLIALLIPCIACSEYNDNGESMVVVEGWIEDGEFPVVKLTTSVPLKYDYLSIDSLERYVLRWQRVTISDGSQTVTLTGKADSRYFPPFIYTTTDMRGQAGRTYQLTIHRNDQPDIVAQATIPQPATIDSFAIEPIDGNAEQCNLYAYTSIPAKPVTYYKIFTRRTGDNLDYLSSFLGVLRSDMIPTDGRIAIQPGRTNFEKNYIPYFTVGDTARVRFARIDSLSYEYWRHYEDMLSFSRNSLFPITRSMPSYISGALGFWQGLGSTYYEIPLNP